MADVETRELEVDGAAHLRVSFEPNLMVAAWWVHLLLDGAPLRSWSGRTDDAAADEAIIAAADLVPGRVVLWQLVLVGSSQGDLDYNNVNVVASQASKLDQFTLSGTVKKNSAALRSGAWKLEGP
jgi:hypothetical protein